LSSFTSALTRLRMANQPLAGISLGRSASLPAASLVRWGTFLVYSPGADGEVSLWRASAVTSWAFCLALEARS
jgi:hypothetical protein